MQQDFHRCLIRVAMLACALGSWPALATEWIGNPTPGDYFQKNLRDALAAGAQLHAGMKQLSADIEAARVRFFSAALGSAARGKAGDEFARLLNDKDLVYANLPLTRGLDSAMLRELELPFIDHGIPEENRPAYIAWLQALRNTLGAKSDKAMLLVDSDTVGRALAVNIEVYSAYQRIRDRNERWRWNERIGKPELNTDEKRHDLSRINISAVPAAVKATLSGSKQFSDWQNAKFYADAKGARYLVYFGRTGSGERDFLFDAAGESARFEAPASEKAAASKYDECQMRARQANLVAPYFTWYAHRCQSGPPPTEEELKKWQHDGPELERLQAQHRAASGDIRLQAEFSLKNYRCEMSIVPAAEAQKDPLLVPQCVDAYKLTDADQKQLEITVKRLSH